MKFQNLLKELKLSPIARQELDEVMALPEVEAILARDEKEKLAERAALIKQYEGVPGRHAKHIDEVTKAAEKAARRQDDAEREVIAARKAYNDARMAVYGADYARDSELTNLKNQLLEGADTRLAEFFRHLDYARGLVMQSWRITSFQQQSWMTGERRTIVETNQAEIDSARTAIDEAMNDCEAMQLQAISAADVAERLTAWFHKLCPLVEQFKVQIPSLDENGRVVLENPRKGLREHLQDMGLEPTQTPLERKHNELRSELRAMARHGR